MRKSRIAVNSRGFGMLKSVDVKINGKKVRLYWSDRLDKYVTIPEERSDYEQKKKVSLALNIKGNNNRRT